MAHEKMREMMEDPWDFGADRLRWMKDSLHLGL